MGTRYFLCLALALLGATAAQADLPAQHRLVYDSKTGLQLNPEGTATFFDLLYRYRLYDRDTTLLRDSYLGVGSSMEISPVWIRGGALIELQPAAVVRLKAQLMGFKYYGALGSAVSFQSPTDDYSDDRKDALEDTAYALGGFVARLSADLQIKLGPFAARSTTRLSYWHADLRPGDTTFYSTGDDILRPGDGWVLDNTIIAVLMLLDERLLLGARHKMVTAFYPGVDDHDNGPYHILGPIIGYTFFEEPGAAFDRPTVVVHTGWYLNHRYRGGPIPYVLFGFLFEGEIWAE